MNKVENVMKKTEYDIGGTCLDIDQKKDISVMFTHIVNDYGGFLKKYISNKIWNVDDVDDIYQTTLLEAYKSYGKYRGESKLRTWLCGVANIVIINYFKHQKKHGVCSNETEDIDSNKEKEDNYDSPEKIIENSQILEKINNLYHEMPIKIKETFELVIIKGESYECASIKNEIPIGTVRSRIARARKLINKDLGRESKGGEL